LGLLLIFLPHQVEAAFKFKDLPEGVGYILGLWGCVLATLGLGYAVASIAPLRNVIWVQMALARGCLECVVGVVWLARGLVTFQQAGPGIVIAAMMTLAYLICYPRKQAATEGQGT
jgi:hypothetical protein